MGFRYVFRVYLDEVSRHIGHPLIFLSKALFASLLELEKLLLKVGFAGLEPSNSF